MEIQCYKKVLLNIGGKSAVVNVPPERTAEEINKILIVCRAYLQQYVYTEMILAECFMVATEESISKKKCFKFAIKKKWSECKKNLRKTIAYYDSYVTNSDFNNEFSMTFYEHISNDLYQLRDKIAVRLQNLGAGDKAGLYANAIILYNLTNFCVGTYEHIVRKLHEELHVNLMESFRDFVPVSAFVNSFDFMELVMGKDFKEMGDHLMTKEILAYFDKVRKGIFDEKTLNEAADNATEDLEGEEREVQRSFIGIADFMSRELSKEDIEPKKVS